MAPVFLAVLYVTLLLAQEITDPKQTIAFTYAM